jgi:hypothetical protein
MTVHTFIHSKSKRAEAVTLLDLGATENFMNLHYAKYLQLPTDALKNHESYTTSMEPQTAVENYNTLQTSKYKQGHNDPPYDSSSQT